MTQPVRVLFWVQHLLGIGHLSRAATLARAMTADGMEVLVASGGEPSPVTDTGAAKLAQLPSARAVDIYFKVLHDENDAQIDDAWRERRTAATLDIYRAFKPDVLITELFPFGRRQFRFEMGPLLEAARADNVRIAASVRDILVAPAKPERMTEMLERARTWYDQVFVHGDPNLVPFDRTFPHLAELSDRVAYTGYVVDERIGPDGPDGQDEILVSAGGGAVAEPLLRAAIAAMPETAARDMKWRFLVGHNLPDAVFQEMQAAASGNVVVERARRDFPDLLRRCRLSISQGGYNTVLETLAAGARAVIAPYAGGLETEQTLRAEALAAKGALQVVPEDDLSPARLGAAIDRALASPPSSAAGVDIGGAAKTSALVKALAGKR
jgi:predicted glycosyltransferase